MKVVRAGDAAGHYAVYFCWRWPPGEIISRRKSGCSTRVSPRCHGDNVGPAGVAFAARVDHVISHEVRYDDGALAIPQQNDALPHWISGRINVVDESDEFAHAVFD
jgi:hypothetical protein